MTTPRLHRPAKRRTTLRPAPRTVCSARSALSGLPRWSRTAAAIALWLLLPPLAPFASAQDDPGATSAATGSARRSAGLRASTPVTLNFVNADVEAVSRAMAVMIDRQIIVDPRVKGLITLYSEQPMPVREAYLQYLAGLRGLGFAIVDNAGLLKVVPEADAKLQAGTVSVGPVNQRGDQVITQIFKLNYENPNNLVAVLRPLISPNNTINANPGNSTLVITDYADNLSRIAKIIAALDQPAATDIEVVPLQHAIASDLATLVQKLGEASASGVPAGQPGGASGVSVLAETRSNALIIRAANPARLAATRALIERLDRPGLAGPAGLIHVVYLKNADAPKLASVLRAAFGGGAGSGGGASTSSSASVTPLGGTGGGLGATVAATPVSQSAQPSTGGFIQADPATNSLVITAAEPLYRQIRSVIDQLDGRRAQVFVESMIVEMDANKAAEMGFQWQGLLGSKGDKLGLVGGTNFGTSASNIITLSQLGSGTATLTPSRAVNGLNLGLLNMVNGVYTLGALARFLESVSGTNILSTPNLVALDNEEAKIVVGQNVPFVTGSFSNTGASGSTVNPFQTVERKDVGLTLKIKPQIGEGGVIRMTVFQENSSVVANSASNANGPTTNKNSIETTIVADDGQIMVLGGQMKEQYDGGQDKVPFLGDMPGVGGLFRTETRSRNKSVLLVFLRPVVLRDAQSTRSIAIDRYEAIRAEQQSAQPDPSRVISVNQGPVLPPLPERTTDKMPITVPPNLKPDAKPDLTPDLAPKP
jgi:general secretion pathway protein D